MDFSKPTRTVVSTQTERQTVVAGPAIVQVSQPGYHPPGLTVRQQISPDLFTADIPEESCEALASDPWIVQIAPATPLRTV